MMSAELLASAPAMQAGRVREGFPRRCGVSFWLLRLRLSGLMFGVDFGVHGPSRGIMAQLPQAVNRVLTEIWGMTASVLLLKSST
jgi:hypothetical protein